MLYVYLFKLLDGFKTLSSDKNRALAETAHFAVGAGI